MVDVKQPSLKLVKKKYQSSYRLGYVGIMDGEVIEFDPTNGNYNTGVTLGDMTDLGGWDCTRFSTYHWLSIYDYDILEPTNLSCLLYGIKDGF